MWLLFFVLFAMSSLAPGREHAATATAITRVILDERPLFAEDESRLKTAATVVAMTFRESSFRQNAKSKTNDHCIAQVHGRPDLALDLDRCIRTALSMLRESIRVCPEYPIAAYASGPSGCRNARAQRISRDRMGLAKKLITEVQP